MAYRKNRMFRSRLTSAEVVEGETIEMKIERITQNKEPIKDGAPEIFTERKDGVISAYNIRTDRWEIAADAMDAVSRSVAAKRDAKVKGKGVEEKAIKESGTVAEDKQVKGAEGGKGADSGAKPIQGGNGAEKS